MALTEKQREQGERIYKFIEEQPYCEIALGCSAGYPYNAGQIRREGDGWIFSNGKVGGSFEPNEDFIIEACYQNRYRIAEYFKTKVVDMVKL